MIATKEIAEKARERELLRQIRDARSVRVRESRFTTPGTAYAMDVDPTGCELVIVCHPEDRVWVDVWLAVMRP